jgi:tryptophan halogenase
MKIVIVGGGTAGWITLAYLAATTDLDITIIHSNEIDIMGVGESTTPTIRHVAQTVGIDESKWMKDGKATFKYGIEFLDFNKKGSRWFHSFDDLIPSQCFGQPLSQFGKETYSRDLSNVEYFLKMRSLDPEKFNSDFFNRSVGAQEFLLENKLSPYNQSGIVNIGDFPGYSYHINAFEFGQSLRAHTPAEKYKEIVATVEAVNYNNQGVESLTLKDGTIIKGDLFFDCTGFKRLLIGNLTDWAHYDELHNDRAVWGPVKGLQLWNPSTKAVAQDAGWIWVTPTQGQVGSGFVYDSKFKTDEQAVAQLTKFWADQGHEWKPAQSVKFDGGRLRNIAVNNVIANGLGQSFIEPLEATSIMVTCVTVMAFSKQYNKHQGWSSRSSKVLSNVMAKFLNNTKDFIKYHYQLSERTEEYWMQYKNPNAISEVCNTIDERLKMSWLNKGETLLNGWNWTSMLVGYDKQYTNSLPDLTQRQLEEYLYFTDMLMSNYEFLTKDNESIQDRLEKIYTQ